MSQPAVSKQIFALEEELGVTLFKREYKNIDLTEEGRILPGNTGKNRTNNTGCQSQNVPAKPFTGVFFKDRRSSGTGYCGPPPSGASAVHDPLSKYIGFSGMSFS